MPRQVIQKPADMFLSDNALAKISKEGDDLEKLSAAVDWEGFRPLLDKALARTNGRNGGRLPFDAVMMFKVLVLKAMHSMVCTRIDYWSFLDIKNV